MLKKFFKTDKKKDSNNNMLIIALLIHAAKIDENYSENEREIILKTTMELTLGKVCVG